MSQRREMQRSESKVLPALVLGLLVAATNTPAQSRTPTDGVLQATRTAETRPAPGTDPAAGLAQGRLRPDKSLAGPPPAIRGRPGDRPQTGSLTAGALHRGRQALMEIRLAGAARAAVRGAVRAAGAELRHSSTAAGLVEAWMTEAQARRLQGTLPQARIRPARRVEPTGQPAVRAGTVESEGVAESGLVAYHDLGADGSGQVIAIIDLGFDGWQALQASGDWPGPDRLERYQVDGDSIIDCDQANCPDFEFTDHGANTVELAWDSAPGATFRVYRVLTVLDWYNALLHASDPDLHEDGPADVISASLSAPLDGVGDGSACPPNWGNPCGTIAEAAEIAYQRGSSVVVAAANNARTHWGGVYNGNGIPPGGDYVDALDWGGGNLNVSACFPPDVTLTAELFWADWQAVDHDYDLYLLRENRFGGWSVVASSIDVQDGDPNSQSPQERISVQTAGRSSGCSGDQSRYAVMVARWDAPEDRNIQLFTNFVLGASVAERSLGFPADSPAVFAAGAIDLNIDNRTLAGFSSRGPVLAPGGALPTPANPAGFDKPEGVSFSGVSTASAGPRGFAGTSASAPHVAGIAAILAQLRERKPVLAEGNAATAVHRGLTWLGVMGDNDLGPAGHDNGFGYGRIKLLECDQPLAFAANTFYQISPVCERVEKSSIGETFADSTLGEYGADWGLWQWEAVQGQWRFMAAGEHVEPVRGYLFLSLQDAEVSLSGAMPDITEEFAVSATGSPGFGRPNLIANPRQVSLAWPELRFQYDGALHDFETAVADNKVRSIMWVWNPQTGQYDEFNGLLFEGTIGPGQAFWIKAQDDVEVLIPTQESSAPGSAAGRLRDPGPAGGDWALELSVGNGQVRSTASLGQHPAARGDFDDYDAEQLTDASAPVVLSIPAPHIRGLELPFKRDWRRPETRDVWVLQIRVAETGDYRFEWSAPEAVLEHAELVLPDGKAVPMARFDTLEHPLPAGTHRFRIEYDARAGGRR